MSRPANYPIARVFFALWPNEAERGALSAWLSPLKHLCGGRMMRSETLHLTLVFIGEIEQSRLEALQLAAREVEAKRFELCFDGAHYWGRNHIVYAAPGCVPPQLGQLVTALEQSLVQHGFTFDARVHKPHITLLRNAKWSGADLDRMTPVDWHIRDFALVQSVPRGGLMGYRVLARFPLDSSGG